MQQSSIDTFVEEVAAKVVAERPQLGPFASYLRNSLFAFHARRHWDAERLAELDQEERERGFKESVDELRVEADKLERQLEIAALLEVLIGKRDLDGPYPEAAGCIPILVELDLEDIEPACKAFAERVAFHRSLRGSSS